MIHGAGLIGLSIALELARRGHRVTLLEPAHANHAASTAAAGMLAAEDPYNPPEILPLSRLSRDLYPAFLRRLEAASQRAVPVQTHRTWQSLNDGTRILLDEISLDPRMLAEALLTAVRATASIQLLEGISTYAPLPHASFDHEIFATGAWQPAELGLRPGTCLPRKGQMLRVALPSGFPLDTVHRSEHIYIVPRSAGPQTGTALVGATVEDAGFDRTVHPEALAELRRQAALLVPELNNPALTPELESWAGPRPATPDGLPLLGRLPRRDSRPASRFVAAGHYRNGILLAPVTAVLLADLLDDRQPDIDLAAFDPVRFA